MDIIRFLIWLLLLMPAWSMAEIADVVVARDGSGAFRTIQEAVNSIPKDNSELKIILVKNGIYNEEIRIDRDFIALVGEDRDSTRIEYYKPYNWDSVYTDIGRAVVNIYANDITLANLTIENTQPEVDIHAFTVFSENNTRTIIINCTILSNGGDTVSPWNGETGMYYLNTVALRGAVDFLCPRGWCYAENIDFYCTRKTTPLWHDGSKNESQKFVVKNGRFDGATEFRLGRNHLDGAFYLLDLQFSEKMLDQPFYLPESAPGPYKWGRRTYFYNCRRSGGNYDWFRDNLDTAPGSPSPEEITPQWTFAGKWDPEAGMPSLLPMAFLPKPDNKEEAISTTPVLTWVPGRNAQSHRIYFGKTDHPEFVAEVKGRAWKPGILEPETVYYWRVDEKNDSEIIPGPVWQFKTAANLREECIQQDTIYNIDNCVTPFNNDSTIPTKAGWQFWFVDKQFADGYSLKMSSVTPHSATHPPHVHPENEIFYVLEGTAEFTLGDEKRIVGPSTSLYCPPDVPHGIRNAGETSLKYLVIKQYPK